MRFTNEQVKFSTTALAKVINMSDGVPLQEGTTSKGER